jgi:hypothetical protein
MRLEEYRTYLERFSEAMNREHYLYYSGQKADLRLLDIYRDYSDLFTLESIQELRNAYQEVSPLFPSQQRARKKLIAFAVDHYLQMGTKDLTQQIAQFESRATLNWQGREIGFYESHVVLSNEPDQERRRQLFRLRGEVVRQMHDLHWERIERQRELCSTLGYKSYLEAYADILGVDYAKLLRLMEDFLAQTEQAYTVALGEALAHEMGVDLAEAHRADVGYFSRLDRFDTWFPKERLISCYTDTLAGLGIDVRRQSHIELDIAPRARKHPRAFCAPIRVPDEVKLVMLPRGGAADYATFFHEAGHAQHFGWTNRNLTVENKHCGDRALSEAYAFLFSYLITDALWLRAIAQFPKPDEFIRLQWVLRLHMLRRYAAKVKYEVSLHAPGSVAEPAAFYTQVLSEATKFKYDTDQYLSDLDEGFYSADYLRAWMFEAQLRDLLKTKYGMDWFRSKKAGDFLKELWDTGELYSADELASQVGVGALDISALLEEFQ